MGRSPLALIANLDRAAVRRGAVGVLMFVAPAYAIALAFNDPDSWFWLAFVFALLFGCMFGGYVAARDRPPTPINHAAVASAAGLTLVLVAALVVQALQGDLSLTAILVSLVILQIGTGFGCVGGYVAVKGAPL